MGVTRKQRRDREKEAAKRFALPEGELAPIDMSLRDSPDWMTRAFSNNRYVVMIMDKAATDKGEAIRAMIQRHDAKPIPNHWSELQRIKNKLFGEDVMGIEYYPKQNELIDQANIYWLWIFPEGVLPIPKVK